MSNGFPEAYEYWSEHYAKAAWHPWPGHESPSPFAKHALASQISAAWRVLELGCGAGCDAAFMAAVGVHVIAVDRCRQAITLAERASRDVNGACQLRCDDAVAAAESIDDCGVAYMRWFLDSVDRDTAARTLKALAYSLIEPGLLLIEERHVDAVHPGAKTHLETNSPDPARLLHHCSLHQDLQNAGFLVETTDLRASDGRRGDPPVVRVVARVASLV